MRPCNGRRSAAVALQCGPFNATSTQGAALPLRQRRRGIKHNKCVCVWLRWLCLWVPAYAKHLQFILISGCGLGRGVQAWNTSGASYV
eukprot:10702340-Alexandrium_andersonii.AAC.1